MDGFLLGDAPEPNHACASIEDLKLQFAGLREAKVTEFKADHVSATFEFRSDVIFSVPENENDAASPNQTLDPAMGGVAAAPPDPAVNGNGNVVTRDIRAHDTLMTQPADDPALQRAVAKHIIASLGSVDGSSWTVRSVSRNASGWTFQYLCKNSTQAWQRQTSKNAAKVLVGESSGKDGQDPVNLARPAFDCRGSITIAFVKNNRMITVKIEHTPFHKTVADLAELFKPPPLPARAEPRRKDGESRKTKRQAAANGAEGPSKKRKKKSVNPDDPNAEGDQAPKPKRPRASRARKAAAARAEGGDQQNTLLNLSPSEAARRRDEATRKLSDNGIDPNTLSTEQFEIFANQSPELQRESLAMLTKYGAERLRIVHPNKDNASPSRPASANGAAVDGSVKKKSKRRTLNEDGTPKVTKTRGSCQSCRAKKMKCSKARPQCLECVKAGLDCYYPPAKKRKPNKSADVVEDEPEEPEEPEEPVTEVPAPATVAEPEVEQAPEFDQVPEEEASDLGSPGFNNPHPPAAEMMSNSGETFSEDLYQPGTSGLAYPQAVPDDMSTGMNYSAYSAQHVQPQPAASSMAYPQQSQQESQTNYPDLLNGPPAQAPAPEPVQQVPQAPQAPQEPQVQEVHQVQTVQPSGQPARPTSSRAGSRRSLPSGSNEQSQNGFSNTSASIGSGWQTANVPASTIQAYASSPSRRSRATKTAAAVPTYDTSQHDGLQAAAALTQAALQKANLSPTARTVSPFQNPTQVARAKSRQGQRSQSRTTASPFQQASAPQAATVDTAGMYNSSNATGSNNVPNYDQYSRYSTAANQGSQASSRVAYEPYAQQNASNSSSTSYPSYDAYTSRSQASTTSGQAAPVTQTMTSSSSRTTAATSSTSWPNTMGSRNSNSYTNNNAAAAANPSYNPPVTTAQQQQPATMQSFNVRPQSTGHTSRTTTPLSYSAQQQTQQPRQQQPRQQQPRQQQPRQQQPYNNYPTQSHSATNQHQQQDWYGFGSNNDASSAYGSNSRGASGYSQSGSGGASYNQHRAMNLSGNTYQRMNDEELYDILGNNPGH